MTTPLLSGHGLGWRPQLPDIRDLRFNAAAPIPLSDTISLRPQCPPVWDQSTAGCCIGEGSGFAYAFDLAKQGLPVFQPSALFIYYNARSQEGTTAQDCGASIRDAIKSINVQGVARESDWPLDLANVTMRPPVPVYTAAQANRSVVYLAVEQGNEAIRTVLQRGMPVVFGFTVYESFYSVGKDGHVSMPVPGEGVVGGHCVAIVGHIPGWYECRNSWGSGWGDSGYFWLPEAYVEHPDLSSDFWCISTVTP